MWEVTIICTGSWNQQLPFYGGSSLPTYEYLCKNLECKNNAEAFEVDQKITDDPLRECPDCKHAVHRLIGNVAFQKKGGGWTPRHY